MKRIQYIIILLLLPVTGLHASVPDSILARGNRAYSNGRFEDAIAAYDTLIAMGYEAPELYFNLGNACYKSNRIAPAILNYERALLLDPGDEDIRFNLEMANLYVKDKIEALPVPFFVRWIQAVVRALTCDTWALLSISSFIAFLLFLSLFLYLNRYTARKVSFWIAIVLLCVSITTLVLADQNKRMTRENEYAIIFSPSVTVKGSPDMNGTDLFVLHEGTKAKVEDRVGEWRKIKLANGNVGWVLAETIETI